MLGRLPSQQPEARERTRLDLVSLASEIAVLTALLDQNLNSVDSHPVAEEIKHSCWQHRIAAMGLLSRETSFDELSVESLRKSVDVFRIRLEDVKDLQRSLEELRPAGGLRATYQHCEPFACGHPRSVDNRAR